MFSLSSHVLTFLYQFEANRFIFSAISFEALIICV